MSAERSGEHWTARHGKPIIFVILTLVAVGVYLATTIPVAVFPEVDFPRILVGIDNGVAPIDQMQVTITRPIEEALNSVQGLERVQSITSRGSVEVDLFFSWKVDMFQTLERVNAALARVQAALPATAKITANRLTFAAFPIMGYSLTSETVPHDPAMGACHLRTEAEAEPQARRLDHRRAGRPGAGVRGAAGSGEAAADADHGAGTARRHRAQQHDRLAGPVREQPPVGAEPGERPGAHARGHRPHRREDDGASAPRYGSAISRRCRGRSSRSTSVVTANARSRRC